MTLFIRDKKELVEYNSLAVIAEWKNGYLCLNGQLGVFARHLDEQDIRVLKEFINYEPKPRYKITNTFLVKPSSVYCKSGQFTYGDIKVEEVWE